MANDKQAEIIELNPEEETVTVDGITVTINKRKYSAFKFLLLTKKIVEAQKRGDGDAVVFGSIDILEYILGEEQLADVLEHFGGDLADYNAIVEWYKKLSKEVRDLKN